MYARLVGLATFAALGAGIAGFLVDLAGVRSGFVTVLVLIFIAAAPTSAIAGLLRGFDLFARIILTCVTTIAVLTMIAMIMLAIGVWSPKGGLVAIALVSGACLLAQHARPTMSKIAERAEPLRQAMIGYCVKVGGERTAAWATTRTTVEPETGAAAAPDPDAAAETAEGAEPAKAAEASAAVPEAGQDTRAAATPDEAADQPAEDPETAEDAEPAKAAEASAAVPEAGQDTRAAATPDEAAGQPAEDPETAEGAEIAEGAEPAKAAEASAAVPEAGQDTQAATTPDEAAEATAELDQDGSSQDGRVTVTGEHAIEVVNGKSVASNGLAAEKSGEPDVVAADSAAGKPTRFRDTA